MSVFQIHGALIEIKKYLLSGITARATRSISSSIITNGPYFNIKIKDLLCPFKKCLTSKFRDGGRTLTR
jgi:hypothetical protein